MKLIQTRKHLTENCYNVNPRTFRKWLRSIGITHSGALTPLELEMIYNKIGDPVKVKQLAEKFAS